MTQAAIRASALAEACHRRASVLVFWLACWTYLPQARFTLEMKISRSEVAHVARLARLALDDAELDALTGDMDAILAYVDQLNRLNTDGIVPTAHAVPMANAFRQDEVLPSFTPEQAQQNAPAPDPAGFRVPRVIE
jgi:aspartyl-tRNA(Asn)/glutamyl-tRNA(Gln) amidotransferase subunit C